MSRKSHSTSSSGDEPLACPTCARRYGLDVRFCSHCGMPLVYAGSASAEEPLSDAHERWRKVRPELTRGELVKVALARNQAEAELIQNLLLEEGIASMLRRTRGFDVPDMLAAGPRDVLVAESGLEDARAVLRQADIETAGDAEPAPLGSRAARILAGILAFGLLGVLLAVVLFEAVK